MGNGLSTSRLRLNLNYVKLLLAAHRMTQAEIANLAGVTGASVSRVLKNSRKVRPETRVAVVEALAKRFGCEPRELCLPGRPAA
jgi:transcriptional regulator with XRE-family HTH domain